MILWIWKIIQLLLPYGLILFLYRNKKSLPANIRTKSGRLLYAIMITTDYGVIFSKEKYIRNRTKVLKNVYEELQQQSNFVEAELNKLNFEEKEELFNGD